MSRVICHMSGLMCHMSRVTYHTFFLSFFVQSGEAYLWRVSYQRGLRRLVCSMLNKAAECIIIILLMVRSSLLSLLLLNSGNTLYGKVSTKR